MIIKKIKTSDGKLTISIPSDRSEITLDLLDRLTPKPGHSFSELETLSILSGVPYETDDDTPCLLDIANMDDLKVFEDTLTKLAFQLKAFAEVQEIPEYIDIELNEKSAKYRYAWLRHFKSPDNKIKVPVLSNIRISPAGAYMEAKEVIKEEYEEWDRVKKEYGDHIEFNPSIASLIRLLSLYFYVPATGDKFNSTRAAEFDKVVRKLTVDQALPIARYFFLRYPNLSKPKVKPSLESLRILKLKRA